MVFADVITGTAATSWKKNFSGDWSFLECGYFGSGYTEVLLERWGIGFSSAVFLSRNGRSTSYLSEFELDNFGREMVRRIDVDPAMSGELMNLAKESGDDLLLFMVTRSDMDVDQGSYNFFWKKLFQYFSVSFPIKAAGNFLDPIGQKELLAAFSEVRVYGEPVYAKTAEYIHSIAVQIAEKAGLSPSDILNMTREEMEEYFRSGVLPSKKDLAVRVQGCVLVVSNGSSRVYVGDDVSNIEKVMGDDGSSLRDEFRGIPAYRGIVRGRVRVILNPLEVSDMHDGEILVTVMTRPEYLHLFRQSIGIVTDAGGMLSHAAITARELKIPTIVGTEIATQVLKDGDFVEVDAERGIVTVLERGLEHC